MPDPSPRDAAPVPARQRPSVDAQLKAWFDVMLQAPIPPALLRHVEALDRPKKG